jgi:pimeloyl-ACP methyl ester carboxylesterase
MPIDIRIHGEDGPTVVLLHGGPGAQGSVGDLARTLADEFRVLEPLQRRSGTEPLTVRRHVEDLAEIAPAGAPIVGASWGAMLALSYAATYPDRVPGLVLIGCGTYDVASRALYEERMRERLGADGIVQVQELQRRIEETEEETDREALFGRLGALASRAQSHEPLESPAEDEEFDPRGHEETWNDAVRLQETGQEPLAFSAIGVPILMLHGEDDPHPGAQIHEVLQTYVPHAELTLLDRCGHEPWRERHAREPFLDLLRERLRSLTGA